MSSLDRPAVRGWNVFASPDQFFPPARGMSGGAGLVCLFGAAVTSVGPTWAGVHPRALGSTDICALRVKAPDDQHSLDSASGRAVRGTDRKSATFGGPGFETEASQLFLPKWSKIPKTSPPEVVSEMPSRLGRRALDDAMKHFGIDPDVGRAVPDVFAGSSSGQRLECLHFSPPVGCPVGPVGHLQGVPRETVPPGRPCMPLRGGRDLRWAYHSGHVALGAAGRGRGRGQVGSPRLRGTSSG